MAVVGEKEVESNTLSIRLRAAGGQSKDIGAIPVAEVIERMKEANATHSNF
jgi:threonyl-tRNA synthetase